MGIKSFSKAFEYQATLTYKDLAGQTLAIDAMYQLHRYAHPFKTSNHSVLTAPDGKSTNHINGVLALILKLQKYKIKQCWVFDNAKGHDSIKDMEIEQRRARSLIAKKKLENIDELFSDTDDESKQIANKHEKNKYERASFSLESYMVIDLKYILQCFDISWIEAPEGYEAEQIAAHMTCFAIDGIIANAVLTPDPDCLLFGAKVMIKNETSSSKLLKYELASILSNSKITIDELIIIGTILGCDFAKKTPKIGPKTILQKFRTVKLTAEQITATKYFAKPIHGTELIRWSCTCESFKNNEKIKQLLEWMVNVKGFSRDRTTNRFDKILA